jgi:hypothetical protein
MIYHADIASQAQASALLAELDKMGPVDEEKLKQWLPANFKRFGIDLPGLSKFPSLSGGRSPARTVSGRARENA